MQSLRWLIVVLGSLGLALSVEWLIRDPGQSSVLAVVLATGFAGTVLFLVEASRASHRRFRRQPSVSGALAAPLWERRPPSRPRIVALPPRAYEVSAEPAQSRDLFRSIGWAVVMFTGFVFFLCLLLTLHAWPRHAALADDPGIELAEQPSPPQVDEAARRRFRRRLR